jgi:replicative DNA helicase
MSAIPFTTRRAPLPADIAKTLPSNLDAERSVLGAILQHNEAIKEIATYLHVDDFFLSNNRVIFEAMLALAMKQLTAGHALAETIDLTTLNERLTQDGKIESAGGIAYLSSIADGMARVSNIRHYADIVKQKSRLRGLIHLTHNLQSRALDAGTSPDDLLQHADASLKELAHNSDENPAVVIGFQSLLKRECPPMDYAIEPLLSSRGTGEIFAWRGTGKSYITTQMAVDISLGRPMMFGGHKGGGGHWPISRAYRTLYVYGEMDDSEIQERNIAIAKMNGGQQPTDEQLGTMCKDYQKNWRPKISSARDRKYIEDRIFTYGYEGVILDNISTLWPTSQENQSDRSAILAEWFTDLNQRGIWIIFLHHAGKSGEQRGDSEKEDMLSFVLKLRRPANYKPDEQLRVEVHVEKNRHKCSQPKMLMPFEIQLAKNPRGEQEWITRPAKEAQLIAAFEMFKNKMPPMFVAQEVGVSKATIYRYHKLFEENPNTDFHRQAEE